MTDRRTLAKWAAVVVVALIGLWLLFTQVFPWVDRQLNDPVLADRAPEAAAVVADHRPA